MPIVPDTKNWTWVLERPCPECGFDATRIDPRSVGSLIRDNAATWQQILDRPARHSERPAEDRWSTLEYACHVRDVFGLFRERLHLMLDDDDPTFANWDQDETAVELRYNDQDPAVVSAELVVAANMLAADFDTLGEQQWPRTGTRSDGSRFTVESFAIYLIHDPIHHVWDVSGSVGR